MGFLIVWLILRAAVALPGNPQGGWLEVTSLGAQGESVLLDIHDNQARVHPLGMSPGLALVCSGGESYAVHCEQLYVEPGEALKPVLDRGVRVVAHVHAGRENVAGARVSLVPKSLRSRRFVTLPLGREKSSGRLFREVSSDAAGRLKTPELAPGEYVLQVASPQGEIYHQPVTVPQREALLPKGPQARSAEAVLDLGEIALAEGVAVSVFVTGPTGEPIAEAKAGALQRDPSAGARFFETAADGQGKAVIAGLAPSLKTEVTCLAHGFRRWEHGFDAPPATVGCFLEPLAQLEGTVLGADHKPVAGATVSGRALERPARTAQDGRFSVVDLAAGTYTLTAAAPGFAPEKVAVSLAAGERRELPPIELAAGSRVRGLIEERASGKPVAGARVTAVEPPGAVDEVSGEDGEVTLAVGENPLHLRASAEGYPETDVEVDPAKLGQEVLAGEKPLEIRLEKGGRLHLVDWDEDTDQPCAGCSVTLQASGSTRTLTVVMDGRGERVSDPLAPGRYAVSSVTERSLGGVVEVRGGAESRHVEVVAGAVTPVALGERSKLIQVRFNQPVPEAWALSASAPSGNRLGERLGDGSFQVRRRPGAVALSLLENTTTVHQAVLAADDDRGLIELPLPGGAVKGTLAAGKGDAPAPHILTLAAADNGRVQASALILEGSAFDIPFLPAGTYTLLVDGRPVRPFLLAAGREVDLGSVPSDPAAGAR